MSEIEREYMKNVDDAILNASGKTLKKLQKLDKKTQLQANTFYDAYLVSQKRPQKEHTPKPNALGKSK